MRLIYKNILIFILFVPFIASCSSSKEQVLKADQSQVQLRSIQTRAFDTNDKEKMLRTVISTLQDLDFVIDRADLELGTLTASKFTANTLLKMTVTVRSRSESQMLVRASAQYGIKAVEDPEPYQDFFASLEKAIFLTAQQVD